MTSTRNKRDQLEQYQVLPSAADATFAWKILRQMTLNEMSFLFPGDKYKIVVGVRKRI